MTDEKNTWRNRTEPFANDNHVTTVTQTVHKKNLTSDDVTMEKIW